MPPKFDAEYQNFKVRERVCAFPNNSAHMFTFCQIDVQPGTSLLKLVKKTSSET